MIAPEQHHLADRRAAVLAGLRAAVPAPRRLVVAFSGGVDSTLLLALAIEALGAERVVAVTARSDSLAQDELVACRRLAARLGATLVELETDEMAREGYRSNGPDRCYHCKTELFERIDGELLARHDAVAVAYGATADDVGDHRPGMAAAAEHRVLAPLLDAGLGKAAIRALSRELDLPTWDKPAQPCLASRVPYGEPVTPEKLARIDRAEALLRGLGLLELRVRHHGEAPDALARIEVPASAIAALLAPGVRDAAARGLRALGFRYVTLDLDALRSGRMNDALVGKALPRAGEDA